MQEFNWKTFTVRIPVNAPVQELYNCWATRQGIERWFLKIGEFKKADGTLRADQELIETGDTYRWSWHGWPDDLIEEGRVLDCNGRDRFKFSFGNAGNCTVNIREEQGTSVVELIQDEIPDDETGMHRFHVGCKTGWTFYFANLKSLMEGGIDLRNKDEKLNNVINS